MDKGGSSIMHVLAGFCDYDFVKMLLEEHQFKKYIDARAGKSGRTPIYQAIAAKRSYWSSMVQTRTLKLFDKQFCTSWLLLERKTTRPSVQRL